MYKKKNTRSCQKTTKTTSVGNHRHWNLRVPSLELACALKPSSSRRHSEPPSDTTGCGPHVLVARENSLARAGHTPNRRDHHGRARVKRKPAEYHRSNFKDILKFCTARQNVRWRHTTNDHSPQPTAFLASKKKKKKPKKESNKKGRKKLHSSKR